MVQCNICAKYFSRSDSLKRHMQQHNIGMHSGAGGDGIGGGSSAGGDRICERSGTGENGIIDASAVTTSIFKCDVCNIGFSRRDSLRRHTLQKHNEHKHVLHKPDGGQAGALRKRAAPDTMGSSLPKKTLKLTIRKCGVCNQYLTQQNWTAHLKSAEHVAKSVVVSTPVDGYADIEMIEQAFKTRIATYRIKNSDDEMLNPKQFLENMSHSIVELILKHLEEHNTLKMNLMLFGTYSKDVETSQIKCFNTMNKLVDKSMDLRENLNIMIKDLNTQAEEFQHSGSGWALSKILHLHVNINKHSPLRGSSYLPLPKQIADKKACINVYNKNDDKCFMWAILSGLHSPKSNKKKTYSYRKYIRELNLDGIEFPMEFKNISKFEKLNDISVNVFGLEKRNDNYLVIGPLHHTKERKPKNHVNLLFIEGGDREQGHFVCIRNLSRLVSSQQSLHKAKQHICDGCLQFFPNEDKLAEHQSNDCGHVKVKIPKKGDKTKFIHHERKMKIPFVIYADTEAILKPVSGCQPDPTASSTTTTHIHEANSFGYFIKCEYDSNNSEYKYFSGRKCIKNFVESLKKDVIKIYDVYLKQIVPMSPLSVDENNNFDSATHCHICSNPFLNNGDKVRDHCHLTGKFRGAAHNACNLNFKIPLMVPIFFHNLSGYDAHLFIKELASNTNKKNKKNKIKVLAQNKESYISFSQKLWVGKKGKENIFMEMRFLDSFKFMASSLDKLVSGLKPNNFTEMNKEFGEKTNLLLRKGVYPYEYMNSWDRFEETSLPEKSAFYSSMTRKHISDEDYEYAKMIFTNFNCQNLREYCELYLRTDVLLLADVFENFRKVCINTYDLDPAHYYTAPGLSWEAMLKYTKVEIELLSDIDMIHFVKKGIRGGISQCSNRHAMANNKYMDKKLYNPNKPDKFLTYLDANNLYGWAMSQPLPISDIEWMNNDDISELTSESIINMDTAGDCGYILEVDLEYPKNIHDLHNDLPFCAENITPPGGKIPKLIPNLNGKSKYIIHSKNLRQALENGLILTKIHRGLKFKQSLWLKSYIDLNTRMRQKAVNDFEKDFFKLMNNSLFGKTIENVEKRKDIQLVTSWESNGRSLGARALIAKPNFHSVSIFTEDFVAIQMNRVEIEYNKPIYIGFSVLELSKTLMYQFHYEYMKRKYGDRLKLLYTDTDSFVYEIKTDDFYEDCKQDILEYYDTSDYPENNIYDIPRLNKKKLGLMKDENCGALLLEFVGLRSKLYAMRVDRDKNKIIKKAKGITKSALENVSIEQYVQCLDGDETIRKSMVRFESIKHQIRTQSINKIALNGMDDKRYLMNGTTDTLAWGHYKIQDEMVE